jgi:hypothetical protein
VVRVRYAAQISSTIFRVKKLLIFEATINAQIRNLLNVFLWQRRYKRAFAFTKVKLFCQTAIKHMPLVLVTKDLASPPRAAHKYASLYYFIFAFFYYARWIQLLLLSWL